MNNKELIKAGHELAKAISNDTPLIEIAKMVSSLATQLDVQLARSNALAAENAGLKVKGREVLKEAAYVYSHYNRMVDHLDGESIDGQTLHEFQAVIEAETPAKGANHE